MYRFPDIKVAVMYRGDVLAYIKRIYEGPEQYEITFNVPATTKAINEGLDKFAIDGWLLMDLGYVPEVLRYRGPEAPDLIWDRTPDKDSENPLFEEYEIERDPYTGEYDRLDFILQRYPESKRDDYGIWFKLVEE